MYDFVIIGGGIIGMSTAMQLIEIYPDARIALLEKEAGPACHQTGHNSGVIHAGVYYTPGSLKAQFCLAGNRATKAFCEQNGIRYDVCGKMLVATSPLEMERMRALWESGRRAFRAAGLTVLEGFDCPTDPAATGLLVDTLCRELRRPEPWYLFADDLHCLLYTSPSPRD